VRAQRLKDVEDPHGSVVLSGDKRAGQVSLQISESPSAGDLVGVASSVAELRIVLLTPGGKRVTEQNAADSGFIWLRRQDSPLRLHKVICSWATRRRKMARASNIVDTSTAREFIMARRARASSARLDKLKLIPQNRRPF
jgi:hypothetical protein